LFKNGKSTSKVKQTCLTLNTLNIKLNPLKEGSKTEGNPAYVLFNEDKSKAEIFLPEFNDGILLNKTSNGNWSNNKYKLISWKGLVIQEEGKPIFGG